MNFSRMCQLVPGDGLKVEVGDAQCLAQGGDLLSGPGDRAVQQGHRVEQFLVAAFRWEHPQDRQPWGGVGATWKKPNANSICSNREPA